MPSKDLEYVAKMASRLPTELRAAQVRGVKGVASHVSRGIRSEIKSATGGNMRLSGARNARIGIKWDRKLSGMNPAIIISPTGPIMLVEENTPSHEIKPKRRKVLKTRSGGFTMMTKHPGTRGKHPWKRGVSKSHDAGGAIYDREIQKAIQRAMR